MSLSNEDYILRVTAADGAIRGFFATTRETVNTAAFTHISSPVVTAALGRLLTAVSIFGATLKHDDDLVTIAVQGDGPMQGVVVTSDSLSRVKGYAYVNQVELPLKANHKLDVSGAIGAGNLTVIKDLGLKEPYVGKVPLLSGEIGEDLTLYFSQSEQTPSAVALGVLVDVDHTVKRAGGFVIQLMPGADNKIVDELEQSLKELPPITTLYDEGKTPYDILDMTLGRFGYVVNDTVPVCYYCNCSHKRVEKALISLGREELESILNEDGKATLHCHFCNKDYNFTKDDIQSILAEI